jgi:hypothetical protein
VEARRYRATGLTVDPCTQRYARQGDLIIAPDGHKFNPTTGLLEVPTSEVVAGCTVWSSAKCWEWVKP